MPAVGPWVVQVERLVAERRLQRLRRRGHSGAAGGGAAGGAGGGWGRRGAGEVRRVGENPWRIMTAHD